MTIHIVYNKAKVLQALRYHFISRPEVKVLIVLVNVFALVSAALFYLHKISPLAFMIGSLLWFFIMLAFWFYLPRLIYKKSATFKEKIDMGFHDKLINLSTGQGSVDWPYNKFVYFIESPYFFHLYINERSFFLIPKEACNEETDTNEVRQLLTEKIGRKAK